MTGFESEFNFNNLWQLYMYYYFILKIHYFILKITLNINIWCVRCLCFVALVSLTTWTSINQPSSHWETTTALPGPMSQQPREGGGGGIPADKAPESRKVADFASRCEAARHKSFLEKCHLGVRSAPWVRGQVGEFLGLGKYVHGCHNERFQQTSLLPAVFLSQNVNNRWLSVYSGFSIYTTILGTQIIIMNIIFLRFTVIRFSLLHSIVVFTLFLFVVEGFLFFVII